MRSRPQAARVPRVLEFAFLSRKIAAKRAMNAPAGAPATLSSPLQARASAAGRRASALASPRFPAFGARRPPIGIAIAAVGVVQIAHAAKTARRVDRGARAGEGLRALQPADGARWRGLPAARRTAALGLFSFFKELGSSPLCKELAR